MAGAGCVAGVACVAGVVRANICSAAGVAGIIDIARFSQFLLLDFFAFCIVSFARLDSAFKDPKDFIIYNSREICKHKGVMMGRAFEYRRAAKEKRWDKMSKIFPKLAKSITVAAKEGGADPSMNAKLRTAIANAKAQNMPKDNIDAAIKRASGKDGQFSEITYEGKAANGVLIFIECTTDNPTRTIANIKSYFNKTPGSQIVPNGSLEFMFARKSVFEFVKPESMSAEDLELALIDFGLEELEALESSSTDSGAGSSGNASADSGSGAVFVAYGDYKDFGTLGEGLEKLGITPSKATLQRIPTSPITISEEQIAELEKLLDKIEDDDDVQAVWTNLA